MKFKSNTPLPEIEVGDWIKTDEFIAEVDDDFTLVPFYPKGDKLEMSSLVGKNFIHWAFRKGGMKDVY